MVALGSGSTLRILGPLPPFEVQKISYSLSFHAGVHAGVCAGVRARGHLQGRSFAQAFVLAGVFTGICKGIGTRMLLECAACTWHFKGICFVFH